MHRLAALLLVWVAVLLVPLPTASAQDAGAIRLTLVSQTPWNTIRDQVLEVRVRAQNTGDAPVKDLSLGLTMFGPLFSRTAYETSLTQDPPSAVIAFQTFTPQGDLPAGGSRVFRVALDLSTAAVSRTQSLVYPLRVELRSGFTTLAALRTPVIFLVRRPETPLSLAWTFVLTHPIDLRPDGVFRSPDLEQQLTRGSRLAGELRALTGLVQGRSSAPVDVVVGPMLVSQLAMMASGYRVVHGASVRQVAKGTDGSALAAEALSNLRTIGGAPQVELSATPYSEAQVPSLESGGLARDLAAQVTRGREVLSSTLSGTPDPSILRPPDSAVDPGSLEALPPQGVSLLLLDPGAAPQA
ncbi:MAG TPA: hypothetical protein VE646_10330, partial [Actinomycetota bacterium]|nr:hypothetical protein [Actinomycetota bacterium]